MNLNLTLSSSAGGADLGADDQVKLYLNGTLIFTGPNAAGSFSPVSFSAKGGDLLRVTAQDNFGGFIALSQLWLSSPKQTKQLSGGYPNTSVTGVVGIFFDETFLIDFQPDLEDDEMERKKKLAQSCYPCPCGTQTGNEGQSQSSMLTSAGATLSYTSESFSDAPASMGYGWSMGVLQARLDFPVSGDLVFYDGSGSFERWVLDGSDYVPAHANNYIAAQENMDGSFTLTFRNQTRMNFNSSGELETILDRNDNTTTFSRDMSGHVTSVDDGEGRVLYVDYDGRTDGQPRYFRRQDASTGLTVELQYDGSDRLWKVIEQEGETTEFLYDGDGRLWKKIDPRGQLETEFTYYSSGDYEGRVETETSYGERVITYTYTETTLTMVEEDLSALTDDEPRTTTLTFRERGQLVQKEDALENVWQWEYADLLNPYLVTMATDPNLNTTVYEYDEDSQLVSVTDAQNNVTSFTYNQPGDAGYTAAKRFLIKEVQRPTVTVPSTVTYDPTQYVYDSLGNLTEIIDAASNSTLFEVVRGDGRVTKVTNRRGQEFELDYTTGGGGLNLGNLETITAPSGPNSAPARVTTFTYDGYDRVTFVEDNDSNIVGYDYDGNDRVIQSTDPRSKTVDYSFVDGVLDYIEMPTNQGSGVNRRQTRFTYDDSSRVNEVFAQIGVSTELSRVRVEFDGFSNLRKLGRLKDSVEVLHQFNFDKLDRLLETIDPLLRETETEHAPFCTERTVTTPRGVERTFRYDSLCRLVQVQTGQELVTYDYDELGRPYQVTQEAAARYGAVTSRFGESLYGSSSRVTQLEYDELDRLTQITFPDSETIEYEYDEEGSVAQMTDVHGNVTRYTYYNDGRLYEVILERPMVADRVFTYAYDAAGRLAQIDYPSSTNISVVFSGPSSEPGWDEAGNLLHMRYLLSSAHLHRFAYTYDDAGNRISMLDTPTTTANAVLWEYGYDWLNRLISVSRDSTLTTVYTYDESDNRLSLEWPQLSETHDFTYDDANQIVDRKLGMTTLETYSHDLDGNMIARTAGGVTTEYRWSDKNRLMERKVDSVSAESHKYDTGGIRESDNDGTKYFSSGAVSLADMRPSSIPVSYFQGHQLLGMEVDGDFYYYVTDALANVRLVLDSSGSIVASAVFDEFGVPEDVTGTADLRPHGYTGGLGVRNDWDSSGLHYMRQRYYDPGLGRWLSADPIGFSGGLNLYKYAAANPASNIDPDGTQPAPTPSPRRQLPIVPNFSPPLRGYQVLHEDTVIQNSDGSLRIEVKVQNKSPYVTFTDLKIRTTLWFHKKKSGGWFKKTYRIRTTCGHHPIMDARLRFQVPIESELMDDVDAIIVEEDLFPIGWAKPGDLDDIPYFQMNSEGNKYNIGPPGEGSVLQSVDSARYGPVTGGQ